MSARHDHDAPAYHVEFLNRVNRGLCILYTRRARLSTFSPENSALVAVEIEAERGRDELRQRVARDCAPWFDGSAFHAG